MPRNAARLAAWQSAGAGDDGSLLADVRAALDDDLDTPAALALIDAAAAGGHPVGSAAALLGVDL
jgi:L-cysteine:1D-myo-inositol 2-amino-2-deoxy-alpha-D-glucopyranoside ligase